MKAGVKVLAVLAPFFVGCGSSPAQNPRIDDFDQGQSALTSANTRADIIARAKSGVGYSYWWGGAAWDPNGSSHGSCSGSCPSCTHSGSYGADCSGFAAKVWVVPANNWPLTYNYHPYSTYNFYNEQHGWHDVSRGSEKKGDALVYHSGSNGHIFIYEKGDSWGTLYAYECKGCSAGCVYNSRTASSSYKAISRDGVIDSPQSDWWFTSSVEGWTARKSSDPLAFTSSGGWSGGVAYATQTGEDCSWLSPATSFNGGSVGAYPSVLVAVYPQGGTTSSHDMQLFWTTSDDPTWNGDKSTPAVRYDMKNGWTAIALNADQTDFTKETISQLRLDFDSASTGTRWIVDYILSQPTYVYLFGDGPQGWTAGKSLDTLHWNNEGWPSIIYADQVGDDAYFYSPSLSFYGAANDAIVVRVYIQNSSSSNHDMKVYWLTQSDQTWDEAKSSYTVNYDVANGTWTTVTIPVGASSAWVRQPITRWRLDVDTVNHGARFLIDYVRVLHQLDAY